MADDGKTPTPASAALETIGQTLTNVPALAMQQQQQQFQSELALHNAKIDTARARSDIARMNAATRYNTVKRQDLLIRMQNYLSPRDELQLRSTYKTIEKAAEMKLVVEGEIAEEQRTLDFLESPRGQAILEQQMAIRGGRSGSFQTGFGVSAFGAEPSAKVLTPSEVRAATKFEMTRAQRAEIEAANTFYQKEVSIKDRRKLEVIAITDVKELQKVLSSLETGEGFIDFFDDEDEIQRFNVLTQHLNNIVAAGVAPSGTQGGAARQKTAAEIELEAVDKELEALGTVSVGG